MHAPTLDGHASSFANHETEVALRNQIATLEPQKQAANLLPHLTDVPRKVRMSAGQDVISNVDGAAHILRISRERFAPDATGSVIQGMAKVMYFKRTDQTMDT